LAGADRSNADVTMRRSSAGWLGFAGGFATMAAMATGLALLALQWLPRSLFSAPPITSVAAAQIPVATLESIFKDLAATGTTSPRRKSAANVDVPTALSLADHSLRGQRTASETDEADFWLKRALGSSFGGPDVGWALTQLGTIYAQSESPRHSYAKAHTLWQLAAAQGDTVAHCFLGALYEHGLGVTASRPMARQHYIVADAANACRSAKDAVVRLKD
jgi:TPR repeat protein